MHIPFCESKCDYCNFVSFRQSNEVKEKYADYLLKEIILSKDKYKDYTVDTIFIGGGTPSCLREKSIKNILNCIINNFNVNLDAEISIEANPNSLTIHKLREFKLAGVNRLSVGLQAYNNKLLKSIGRIHTINQFDQAIKNAKSVGFENINADILLGLPHQKMFDIVKELKHLINLKITHISAYGLIVEENTKLFDKLEKGEISLPNEQKSLKFYQKTLKFLKKHKFNRYEVSNFCKKSYECKHNLKYWNNQFYIGFGLASHSFFENTRWENCLNLTDYFDYLDKNELPNINVTSQSLDDLRTTYIMTALRKSDGIDLNYYKDNFNQDLLIDKDKEIKNLIKLDLIKLSENNLFATDSGFEVLNQIILQLI